MFLCQPLLEVLVSRSIEDIDGFLKVPTWNDLPDPFSIPAMEHAAARVHCAIRNRERIAIFGDYDCDGVLGAHILRSVLSGLRLTTIRPRSISVRRSLIGVVSYRQAVHWLRSMRSRAGSKKLFIRLMTRSMPTSKYPMNSTLCRGTSRSKRAACRRVVTS
jgi:hypothetical protein